MSTLKEFKEKALSQENSFLLNDRHGKILCVKVPIGQAEYIYTMREWLNMKDIVTDISDKLEMTAILKNGNIYMFKPYNVMDRYDEEYPENVYHIRDTYLENVNLQIKKNVFDSLYDELEIVPLTESEELNCLNIARESLIYDKNIDEYILNRQMGNIEKINAQKFADYLCGIINLEEEMRKDFNSKKEMWVKLKSSMERIKELVFKMPETVLEEYEQRIVDGLHSVDAKTVQVEFLYNGKSAIGKVEKDVILRILATNDYFSDYSFTTMKSGEKIIKELGAGTCRINNPITCKHINKITYGKKVLYEKNETL